jgi:hypothetical protein
MVRHSGNTGGLDQPDEAGLSHLQNMSFRQFSLIVLSLIMNFKTIISPHPPVSPHHVGGVCLASAAENNWKISAVADQNYLPFR